MNQVKANVKQIITDLARDNFYSYPESYKIENGLSTNEATEAAQDLAIGYFENRQDEEIERDEKLGITKTDYVEFVMGEYERYATRAVQ